MTCASVQTHTHTHPTTHFKLPSLRPFSCSCLFLLLSFSPECLCLFLSSKNRADHFNRGDLVVCLNSPSRCTAPDVKDKRGIERVCVFYICMWNIERKWLMNCIKLYLKGMILKGKKHLLKTYYNHRLSLFAVIYNVKIMFKFIVNILVNEQKKKISMATH